MKLGQKVRFQKELKKNEYWNVDKEETEKFRESKGIGPDGLLHWQVRKHETVLEGIVCGKRVISLNGYYDGEGYYDFRKRLNIYLVATNMSGFHRVPEEWLEVVEG